MSKKRLINSIFFPNTAKASEQSSYTNGKDGIEIKEIYKNGEMALICWFAIFKDGKLIAEIKESVCDVFVEEYEEKNIDEIF